MRKEMHAGIDFGQVPGTAGKPTLLKPGAEKMCVMFCLAERFDTDKTWLAGDHLMVESKCRIHDMQDRFLGEASAVCSTKESKYAWRKSERTCPECGKAAIIKGKAEFGGGWLCWAKKGGCGFKFEEADTAIISQQTGRVPNPDLPDSYNTVVRIAEKRAFIAAVRMVTGASSLFDEEVPDQERVDDGGTQARASIPPNYVDELLAELTGGSEFHGESKPAAAAGTSKPARREPKTGQDAEEAEMQKWMKRLQDPVTAEYINNLLDGWRNLPEGNTKKLVGKAISERCTADGLVFDQEKRCYRLTKEPAQTITGEQCIDLAGLLDKANYNIQEFLKDYQITRLGELPAVHWTAASGMLTGMIANKKSKAGVA